MKKSFAAAVSLAIAFWSCEAVAQTTEDDCSEKQIEAQITEAVTANAPSGTDITVKVEAVDPSELEADQPKEEPRRFKLELKNREFDDREKIALLLSAHCDFPSKDDLLSTSPDAEKHIIDILGDETVLESIRERALEALAYFKSPENEAALRENLERVYESENFMLIMYSMRGYASVAEQRAVPLLARFMEHKLDYVRISAIRQLQLIPGKASLEALQNRLANENNRYFKSKLEDAIKHHCTQKTRCTQ